MKTYIRRTLIGGLLGLCAVAVPACDKFVAVDNPNELETDSVDPERDASLLSQSVYTRFVTSFEYGYILGAWFTNHARVGDTFPTRNAVGQRHIPDDGNDTDARWNSIHTNIQFARTTIRSIEAAGASLDLARAWWVSGFSILQEAEWFCAGTIAENTLVSRGKMTSAALLDSAINDLRKAQDVISQLPSANAEATNLSNSAQVGIARALLQLGRNAEAATEAAKVPAGFTYSILHIDNSSQRALGNQVWSFSDSRPSIVVGPEFRAMADAGDPRVDYTDTKLLAQDGVPFFRQEKHPGWDAPMRFASKLEADYIAAEASQNAATIEAFVNTRRAVGGKAPLAGLSLTQAMTELMLEKSIDFWLEGHEMRDFRRNPAIYPFVLPTGDNYYKPELGPVGTDTCWPVPFDEKQTNPKWVE
jgi:starch-binding outer membrane protein, SusD/RagB family